MGADGLVPVVDATVKADRNLAIRRSNVNIAHPEHFRPGLLCADRNGRSVAAVEARVQEDEVEFARGYSSFSTAEVAHHRYGEAGVFQEGRARGGVLSVRIDD
jgi:hypothetical protein